MTFLAFVTEITFCLLHLPSYFLNVSPFQAVNYILGEATFAPRLTRQWKSRFFVSKESIFFSFYTKNTSVCPEPNQVVSGVEKKHLTLCARTSQKNQGEQQM